MKSMSYTTARDNLAKMMDHICEDHMPIAITRKGEGSVVMISMDDYRAEKETAYLLRNPKGALRLLQSIADIEAGKGQERELIECE